LNIEAGQRRGLSLLNVHRQEVDLRHSVLDEKLGERDRGHVENGVMTGLLSILS
jgi:hypothetical protein